MFKESYQWHFDYARLATDTGFAFERHKSQNLDKNKFYLIDIEQVIRERDLDTIEKCIPSVIQFVLDPEQTEILDASFVRTFRICQLSVEYLLFCKKYLDNTVVLLKEQLQKQKEENEELKVFVEELKGHISSLMKKLKTSSASFKCSECGKVFTTEEYLTAHKVRRHNSESSDRVHMEIKELKGRLNTAEQVISKTTAGSHSDGDFNSKSVVQLQEKFEGLKAQVESELKLLHSQQNFEEKCERWFGLALQTQIKAQDRGDEKGIETEKRQLVVKESCTQTVEFQIVENPPQNEKVEPVTARVETPVKELETLDRGQPNLKPQFEEVLDTKVTSSLQKIQDQMQSFWTKLSEIETAKKIPRVSSCPVPRSRQRYKPDPSENEEEVASEAQEEAKEKKSRPSLRPRSKYTLSDEILVKDSKRNFTGEEEKKAKPSPRTRSSKPKSESNDKPKPIITAKTINEEFQFKKPASVKSTSIGKKESDTIEVDSDVNSTEMSNELSSSESERLHVMKVVERRKPSVTRAAADNEAEVFQNFRHEVEKVIVTRLQDLGVSPEWHGMPLKSYQRAMEIVTHQASLMKKTYPDFDKISQLLEKDISKSAHDLKKTGKKNPDRRNVRMKNGQKNLDVQSKRSEPLPPKVEISNRRMYESDSETDAIVPYTVKPYQPFSAVIEELKSKTKVVIDKSTSENSSIASPAKGDGTNKSNKSSADILEQASKGVLKNYPSVGSLTKKKVLFNLSTEEGADTLAKVRDGGSTTSIESAVLDGTPRTTLSVSGRVNIGQTGKAEEQKKDLEDLSDFDFSEM